MHNADVHVLIGAPLEEDLLTGATFLGCSFLSAVGARHMVGDVSQNPEAS
jgi:hypothetical protein